MSELTNRKMLNATVDNSDFPIVHVYTVCWNEEMMLPHFLNHYAGFEKIFVYDNESTDGSRDCVEKAKNTELLSLATEGEFSKDILSHFRNNVWKQSRGIADFVIICDVDEFLYHPDFMSVIKAMKQQNATLMLPMAYQMIGDHVLQRDEDLLACIPEGVRLYSYDKCIMFDPNEIEEINFVHGSHVCRPIGRASYFRVPGLCLLHYKYLNITYVWSRYRQYVERTSAQDIAKNHSPHHRMSSEELEQRYEILTEVKIDVVALTKRTSDDGWIEPPSNLAELYQQGLRAFKNKDYVTALDRLEKVADWSPTRYRLGAALARILYSRQLFYYDWRYMLGRTEAIASGQLPREQVLLNIAKFYRASNHPGFEEYCINFIAELKQSGEL